MSHGEYGTLYQLGERWFAEVWATNKSEEKAKEILGLVNDALGTMDKGTFKVYTVFQKYDPYVHTKGHAGPSYKALCGWAAAQPDGGKGIAQEITDFFYDKPLSELSPSAKALVVIACFAEVGRGYRNAEFIKFASWMTNIIQASSAETARVLWLSYNTYWTPSLTYAVDVNTEYGH